MSLFDKYGGEEFFQRLLDIIYQKNLSNPVLAPYFRDSDVERIKSMYLNLLRAGLGTGEHHFHTSVKRVHSHLHIPKEAFLAFYEVFIGVLQENAFTPEDMEEVSDMLKAFEEDVVT